MFFLPTNLAFRMKKSATEVRKASIGDVGQSISKSEGSIESPIFLINSLNVLSNLVYEDADRSAEIYFESLSKILPAMF